MPVIQQEGRVKTIKGLPLRWGKRAYRELAALTPKVGAEPSERYLKLSAMLDQLTAAPLPLDATDAQLCILAEECAGECLNAAFDIAEDPKIQRKLLGAIAIERGVAPPEANYDDEPACRRMLDAAWWRGRIRKAHGRLFEAAAIRLGFVSVRAGAYASDETVSRRLAQIERNKGALEAAKIENEQGQQITLADASAKSVANPAIRRKELMLRLAGCEKVANERGDVGVFVTLSVPSKYHAVLQASGEMNPKYGDYDPRESQLYLRKTWALIRTAYGRYGIKPYGFRIAEPHHDGCVHWHMLLFMAPREVEWFCHIVSQYALAVDGDEPGAQAHRAQFELIDASKGSAAAYLSKYISKNVNDDEADAHDEVIGADGEPVKIAVDKAKKASQRVGAWAGAWGIRQFQPIGQPPVTVWRELRRVAEGEIEGAPEHVRAAWDAAQRVYSAPDEDGAVELVHAADFGDYIKAQGGVCRGRGYAIELALVQTDEAGRYGDGEGVKPLGVQERAAAEFVGPVQVFESVRFTWTKVKGGAAFDSPWSPVNNCTEAKPWPKRPKGAKDWFNVLMGPMPQAEFDDVWFDGVFGNLIVTEPAEAALEMLSAEWAAVDKEVAAGRVPGGGVFKRGAGGEWVNVGVSACG